jgi:hypothetical protein
MCTALIGYKSKLYGLFVAIEDPAKFLIVSKNVRSVILNIF